MKAVVQDSYGSADVLEVREVAKPVPTDDEVRGHCCIWAKGVGGE